MPTLRPVLGLGEEVLDIAVTPDRGYALSIRGVAREAATAYGVAFTDPGTGAGPTCRSPPTTPAPRLRHRGPVGVRPVHAAHDHRLRSARADSDVAEAAPAVPAGCGPVSLAVDITNYVMLETGQPLHAFDLDLLQGPVRARRAAPGETLETLDHVVRDLDPDDMVIADDRGAVGLAGTMGGLTSGDHRRFDEHRTRGRPLRRRRGRAHVAAPQAEQ